VGLSDVEKSVVKATYDDDLAPKEKHVVCALIQRHIAAPAESCSSDTRTWLIVALLSHMLPIVDMCVSC
jgi:hypothetical protein